MVSILYFGGPILTMEATGYADCVLTEDGHIRFVGTLKEGESLATKGTKRVNLQGRAMLPAFIDSHSHLAAEAFGLLQLQLGDCVDVAEICSRITERVATQGIAKGEWVRGMGYDHNTLTERRPPSKEELDRACPDYPVILSHASGHVGLFNSAGLALLAVDEKTPCPEGGVMEVGEDGLLTGYMEETAFFKQQNRVPMDSPEKLFEAFQKAQENYASQGITTVQEGMLSTPLLPLYQGVIAQKLLWLDVVGYADASIAEEVETILSSHVGQYAHHFKLGGRKMFLDGSPQGRTAWMRAPYLGGEDGYCGYPVLGDGEVLLRLRSAQKDGRQMLTHCNGDRAAEQLIFCMDKLLETQGEKLYRPVMIHAQFLGVDQMPRVRALGIIPSFFVAHIYHWGEIHRQNFGAERASRICPLASALRDGILFTLHQDTPVIRPNMRETIWCAVCRQTKAGDIFGAQERISPLDALKAVTINAAYQYGEEGEKGSLARGKRADFVILDRDPLAVSPQELRELQVQETIKSGRSIYSFGQSLLQ